MSGCHRLCARLVAAVVAVCLITPVGVVFAQDADATVDMQGLKFVPSEIHVGPGDKVRWTNSSSLPHTVTADDGSFDSGYLVTGAEFSMSFDEPGTYAYVCLPHLTLGMVGTVIVDEPD